MKHSVKRIWGLAAGPEEAVTDLRGKRKTLKKREVKNMEKL